MLGSEVWFKKKLQLKYFNVQHSDEIYGSNYWSNYETLSKLTAFCSKIEKISVNYCSLKSIMKCIIQSRYTLTVLCFKRGYYINADEFKQIVTHGQELLELNISFLNSGSLSQSCVDFLCDKLTTKIEKLDISGQVNFRDEQLKRMLRRCSKLTEFAFAFTSVSDESVDTITKILSPTLMKIDPSHVISFDRLLEFESMPKLKKLRLGWLQISDEEKEEVKKIMPKLLDSNEKLDIALPYTSDLGQKGKKPTGFWEMKCKPQKLY